MKKPALSLRLRIPNIVTLRTNILCVRLIVTGFLLWALFIFPLCCYFCLSFESSKKCQPSLLGGNPVHAVEKLNLGIVKYLVCRLWRFNASVQTAEGTDQMVQYVNIHWVTEKRESQEHLLWCVTGAYLKKSRFGFDNLSCIIGVCVHLNVVQDSFIIPLQFQKFFQYSQCAGTGEEFTPFRGRIYKQEHSDQLLSSLSIGTQLAKLDCAAVWKSRRNWALL